MHRIINAGRKGNINSKCAVLVIEYGRTKAAFATELRTENTIRTVRNIGNDDEYFTTFSGSKASSSDDTVC